MSTNVSMTGTGIVVVGVTYFLGLFGIIPADGQIFQFIKDVATVVGWVLTIWGQLRRSDLWMGLIRTN